MSSLVRVELDSDKDEPPESELASAVRAVLFATGLEEFPYATHGGTLFVVSFASKLFGVTCRHVFGDFPPEALLVTQDRHGKKGSRFASIQGIRYPSSPRREAIGTDIIDLCVIEFSQEIGQEFFHGTAFPLDVHRIGTSRPGNELVVIGMLKDPTAIDGHDISVNWCRLEFTDVGISADPTLRRGVAGYHEPSFQNLTGISGAPVFDRTSKRLCGMVVRGGMDGSHLAVVHYIDIFDIMALIEAVAAGDDSKDYIKTVID
ncbi:hypothetical protein WN73_12180 [Bradyrhizobium sp. CCBAU 45394]|uniref:hypothetical protein n=1 Tax=unclassified Bradyrhizobium TaxID=2631580 RepID=UPI002304A1B8|nr:MULTISPECIES: hypothetical protein [unclassified Bradyrhizobium]MDA9391406.1 hypothetical protein [Bradyrhizobium sp. CCBAU 45394]MDA9534827.1 hypothetical protein [Bradyrhizobium sp. CCBAU 21362]